MAKVELVFGRLLAGERPAGRLYRDDELLDICFLECRARAVRLALAAYEEERKAIGRLDLDYLLHRENSYILSSEIAAIAGQWENGEIADGLSLDPRMSLCVGGVSWTR